MCVCVCFGPPLRSGRWFNRFKRMTKKDIGIDFMMRRVSARRTAVLLEAPLNGWQFCQFENIDFLSTRNSFNRYCHWRCHRRHWHASWKCYHANYIKLNEFHPAENDERRDERQRIKNMNSYLKRCSVRIVNDLWHSVYDIYKSNGCDV